MRVLFLALFLAGCATTTATETADSHVRLQMQCPAATAPVIADCYCNTKEPDKGFLGLIFNAIGNILGGAFF